MEILPKVLAPDDGCFTQRGTANPQPTRLDTHAHNPQAW
jgi:hypothetical protein